MTSLPYVEALRAANRAFNAAVRLRRKSKLAFSVGCAAAGTALAAEAAVAAARWSRIERAYTTLVEEAGVDALLRILPVRQSRMTRMLAAA